MIERNLKHLKIKRDDVVYNPRTYYLGCKGDGNIKFMIY